MLMTMMKRLRVTKRVVFMVRKMKTAMSARARKVVTKKIDGKEVKETKTWKYFQLGPYRYLSFVDVKDAVDELSAGLIELGIGRGEVFNVYAQTRCAIRFMGACLDSLSAALTGS